MSIVESQRPRAEQVLDDIFNAYVSSFPYNLVREPPPTGITNHAFAHDRINKVHPLIVVPDWDSPRKERDSFMSEWIVMLGFKRIIERAGLKIELAPPHLETGSEGRKGVDLIASRENSEIGQNLPTFAINVKLKHPRRNGRTEIYKYDNVLGCPAIELSLGDFSIQTKKSGQVSIIPWLRKVATPNLTNSGHIPGFYEWQRYLIHKVTNTISHFMIKTDDFIYGDYRPSEHEVHLFPTTEHEFKRFYENLSFSYMFFKELND